MTEAVYTATAEYILEMAQRPVKHRVSVSGVLKRLGVSRSGYNAWKKRCPSATEKHPGEVKEKILKIYEDSHQNYGAPKITRELWKDGEKIAVKTVANYMRQILISARSCTIFCSSSSIRNSRMQYGCRISHIFGHLKAWYT